MGLLYRVQTVIQKVHFRHRWISQSVDCWLHTLQLKPALMQATICWKSEHSALFTRQLTSLFLMPRLENNIFFFCTKRTQNQSRSKRAYVASSWMLLYVWWKDLFSPKRHQLQHLLTHHHTLWVAVNKRITSLQHSVYFYSQKIKSILLRALR